MSDPIKLPEGAWVLVADGEKALFMRNVTDAQDPMFEIVREKKQDNPPDREQGTDSPGRKADTGVGQRSAMEETDWHQIAKERFADEIAERLYKYAHAGRFDRILLIAPPATLGDLRQKLHKEVTARVVGEIPKTLTNHPLDQIEKLLKRELNEAA
ncbi:baeRF12 domain-containing protein [Pseudooceanicola sp. 502str34]|uniref:baeRF12 domain-containing protein n=1 Tax=Maritimibacter alkaliphilus TaxID=404236 RepID=UPI001C94A738|nr:host attachment family protein [Maritimibacter alkaliphilus]MBY6089999.1 host attachment family protein [Maritimibacter alkaliphilus]